jgi:hypothetical protein
MKQAGFARHIGVSNFTVPLLQEAVKLASEPLVNNQIEWHPYLDQSEVVQASRRYGLSVTAYSPIARGRAATDNELRRIGMRHRNARVRPMDEQEIDLGEAQPCQALLDGALERGRRQMVLPHLGGDEHFVARQARCAQALSNLALIAVHFRGVDMAIAEPQRPVRRCARGLHPRKSQVPRPTAGISAPFASTTCVGML